MIKHTYRLTTPLTCHKLAGMKPLTINQVEGNRKNTKFILRDDTGAIHDPMKIMLTDEMQLITSNTDIEPRVRVELLSILT